MMMTTYEVLVPRYPGCDSWDRIGCDRWGSLGMARAAAPTDRPWRIQRTEWREEPDICTATRGLPALAQIRHTIVAVSAVAALPEGCRRMMVGSASVDVPDSLWDPLYMRAGTSYGRRTQTEVVTLLATAMSEGHEGETAILRAIALGGVGQDTTAVVAARAHHEAEVLALKRQREAELARQRERDQDLPAETI